MGRGRRTVWAAACAWAACCAAIAPGTARADASDTLVLAVGAPVTSIDPHYHNLSPNNSLTSHIFERLVGRDALARPIPGLALSWSAVEPTTWEFRLRQAHFHDGSAFTAEDVAYSLARVPRVRNSPSSFATFVQAVTGVDIVDAHTVRMHTAAPYPLLPVDLADVAIISHALGADPATEDFNSGRDAIGTGPFRFVSFKPGAGIELERNEEWWGEKPAWRHVSYRIISNDGARTAALLAGDVALIDSVPTSDANRLREDKRVSISEIVGLRLIFLALDQGHETAPPSVTGPNGEALARNPLRDLRVRQALSLAINRPLLVDRVMENAALPTGQFLPQGSFGYVPDLPAPAYDPARAKALLAEAGFPDGLRITLHASNDRYPNDAKIVQAVGQMWTRIGVRTTVESEPWSSYVGHANKQEYAAMLFGWASASGEASNPLRALVARFDPATGMGAANRGRYASPTLDALIKQALATVDDGAREHLLQQATRAAMDDVAILPLHQQKNVWASRADLHYEARADEGTLAMGLRPVAQ
jgi:peptide/nickel transport system substrate-binding protein